jgi:hypothetical protein
MPGIEPRFIGHPGRRITTTFEVFPSLLLGLPEDEVTTILRNIAVYQSTRRKIIGDFNPH